MLIKGFLIGWAQRDGTLGWLSIPLATVFGPALIVLDLIDLLNGRLWPLHMLYWALGGFVIGAALARRSS